MRKGQNYEDRCSHKILGKSMTERQMTKKRQHNDDFDAEDILSQSMLILLSISLSVFTN